MLNAVKKIVLGILNASVRIAILLIAFSMIRKACITAYDYGYRVFSEKPMTEGEGFDEDVVIPVGSSAMDIGKILKNKGLIRDEKLFYVQVLLSSYRGKLNPGDYILNTSMTAEDMMRVIAGADREDEDDEDKESSQSSEGNSTVTLDVTSESGAIDEDAGDTGEDEGVSEEGSGEGEEDAQSDGE